MNIGVAGISGRMGQILATLIVERGETLVGGIGCSSDSPGATRSSIAELAADSEVVIDFTHPGSVEAHAAALAAAGTPWVLGTTGLDIGGQAAVHDASARIGVVQAANFSLGMALVEILARQLAAALPATDFDAEILEMHHRGKRDAPSGTALALGQTVAAGRGRALPEIAARARDGQTGPRQVGDIGFAILRGGSVVGEHAVSFTGHSERITISHQAFDRRVFADGALRAAHWLPGRSPGLYSMVDVLGPAAEP